MVVEASTVHLCRVCMHSSPVLWCTRAAVCLFFLVVETRWSKEMDLRPMSTYTKTVFNKECMPPSETKGTIVTVYKESAQPANPGHSVI